MQADLGVVKRIKHIATQGRSDASQWVKTYTFAYSITGLEYKFILDPSGNEQIFNGNVDQDSVVMHDLLVAIAARYVRVYPQTWLRHMSLRWEVYGCDISK